MKTQLKLSPIKYLEYLSFKNPGTVSLAQGIPDFDVPIEARKAIFKALSKGRASSYSSVFGLDELREAIEIDLAKENMFYDFENEILITAGALEGIFISLKALIEKNKNEVIIFSPSYPSYFDLVCLAEGKPVWVNLDKNQNWQIDFNAFLKKVNRKTKAIIICNPNNPTGTIFEREDLLKIAEVAKKRGIFIILDEVYKDMIYLNQENNKKDNFFSLAQVPEFRKNVIRVFSFSKIFSIPGWRVAYLHSDKEIVSKIIKYHDLILTCAPVISQYGALQAINFSQNYKEKIKKELLKRRELICQLLDNLKDYFSYQVPQATYFVFPKILPLAYEKLKAKNSLDFALKLIEKARVAVVFGSAFGKNGEGHLRFCFGREEKKIKEAFKRIEQCLKN